MEVQTYNEFKVFEWDKDKPVKKEPTKRKSVRIDAGTAKVNNGIAKSTGLYYELSKTQPEDKKPTEKKATK